MKVYTTRDFDRQTAAIVEGAKASKPGALARAKRLQDEFNYLRNLGCDPNRRNGHAEAGTTVERVSGMAGLSPVRRGDSNANDLLVRRGISRDRGGTFCERQVEHG